MPTISQLPVTQTVVAADSVPISQGGSVHAVSVGALLASTQPAIIVQTGALLGRVSLGAGGPEAIAVGAGLALNQSTLQATPFDYGTLPTASVLPTTASVVVTNGGTDSHLLGLTTLRGLFSAGNNVTINGGGTISASGGTVASNFSIGTLATATVASAADLLPISQSGTTGAITYANLINGQTIDHAQPAAAASDGDTFWVAQGSNTMLSQTFSAIWPWILGKLVTAKTPVVELAANTTLDGTVHNARVLICSQPVTLTPVSANMGNGFQCEIINLSSGTVSFTGSIVTSSGASSLAPGQAATLRCLTYSAGTVLYAFIGGGGAAPSVPGQVTGLTSSGQTTSSITLTWNAPTTGATPTGYLVQFRPTGTSVWSVVTQSLTSPGCSVTALTSNTSYDFCVFATNGAGSGVGSSIFTIATTAINSTPGIVTGLMAGTITSASVQLTWQAPSSGAAPTSYTVQYRVTGATSWTGAVTGVSVTAATVSGLSSRTSYDFSVFGTNTAGSGPTSLVMTASTAAPAGAVSSIVWNVAPFGSYTHGSGVIGVNVHVSPSSAAVQFGFSTSATVQPSSWTAGGNVNTDLWGAYVPTPPTAGTWYAWAAGTDGSAPTVYSSPFTVT